MKPLHLALLLLWPWCGVAATITASSSSGPDIQAAINSANHAGGDTVSIPAGTNVIVTNIVANFPITIQGAGASTVLIDEVPRTLPVPSVFKTGFTNDAVLSLGNFTIWGGVTNTTDASEKGLITWAGNGGHFRFHHITILTNYSDAIGVKDGMNSVIDHNVIASFPYGRQGIKIWAEHWPNNHNYADDSWATDDLLGTENFIFIEDNYFLNQNSAAVLDFENGGRVDFRYNVISNSFISNHGTDTGQRHRSGREFIIHDNVVAWQAGAHNSPWPFAIYLRGATGLIYGNQFWAPDADTYRSITFANYRVTTNPEGYPWGPWGPAQGATTGLPPNVWDGNTDATGYPTLDQMGRGKGDLLSGDTPINTAFGVAHWPRQVSSPIYIWNNKRNALTATVGSQSSTIQLGRDWFEIPKPGFTDYTYPHPYVTGAPPPPPPPPPPPSTNPPVLVNIQSAVLKAGTAHIK